MTLRNPIKDRKKVQEVFSKYNGTPNVGDNSFIKKSVLASALCDAMGKASLKSLSIDQSPPYMLRIRIVIRFIKT